MTFRRPRTAGKSRYGHGGWARLQRAEERGRYSVIVDLLAQVARDGTVLDVGCGEGLLFHRFRVHGYSRYVGIDISEAAVATLGAHQDERTQFMVGDAAIYVPTEQFDAIVFNEVLYYFPEPMAAFERYAAAVNPSGALIISTWLGSPRARAILRALKRVFVTVEEVKDPQTKTSWLLTVLKARPSGTSRGPDRRSGRGGDRRAAEHTP